MADCLTLAKSHRGEADFSLLSLHETVAHFGSVLRTKKKRLNINDIKANSSNHNFVEENKQNFTMFNINKH